MLPGVIGSAAGIVVAAPWPPGYRRVGTRGKPDGVGVGAGAAPPGRSLRTHHRGSPAAGGAAFWRVWTPQGMRVTLDTTVTFSAGLILGLYRGGLWG
jgi:hypothetical protein